MLIIMRKALIFATLVSAAAFISIAGCELSANDTLVINNSTKTVKYTLAGVEGEFTLAPGERAAHEAAPNYPATYTITPVPASAGVRIIDAKTFEFADASATFSTFVYDLVIENWLSVQAKIICESSADYHTTTLDINSTSAASPNTSNTGKTFYRSYPVFTVDNPAAAGYGGARITHRYEGNTIYITIQ